MQTRRWFGMVLTLTILGASAGTAAAQGGMEKRAVEKATPILMKSCKVTKVDGTAKTFTVVTEGKEFTFSGAKLRSLPTVGQVLDVTYNQTGGGLLEASNLNLSKSNIN